MMKLETKTNKANKPIKEEEKKENLVVTTIEERQPFDYIPELGDIFVFDYESMNQYEYKANNLYVSNFMCLEKAIKDNIYCHSLITSLSKINLQSELIEEDKKKEKDNAEDRVQFQLLYYLNNPTLIQYYIDVNISKINKPINVKKPKEYSCNDENEEEEEEDQMHILMSEEKMLADEYSNGNNIFIAFFMYNNEIYTTNSYLSLEDFNKSFINKSYLYNKLEAYIMPDDDDNESEALK